MLVPIPPTTPLGIKNINGIIILFGNPKVPTELTAISAKEIKHANSERKPIIAIGKPILSKVFLNFFARSQFATELTSEFSIFISSDILLKNIFIKAEFSPNLLFIKKKARFRFLF